MFRDEDLGLVSEESVWLGCGGKRQPHRYEVEEETRCSLCLCQLLELGFMPSANGSH